MNHETCAGCRYGKEHRIAFNHKKALPAKEVLARVHTDTTPLEMVSLGGYRHILSFIDEHSRFAIVYLIKTKDETVAKWRIYKAYVERLHNTKIKEIKEIWCDNI